jgi:predicted nucleic acid-binding protein
MIIISDSSPIVSLIHLQELNLLKEIYSEIILPQTVYEELLAAKIIEYDFLKTHNYLTALKQK